MLTRRILIQASAAATVLGALPYSAAFAQTPPQRRSLHDMDLDDPVLVSLREFVTQMKDPSRDGQPVSWVGFANIHGTDQGFNLCPHGNWYFLPWHRGYVRMYEQAVRAVTGKQDFAMPYWDWSAHPDFPAAFGDDTFDGQPNPLFVPGRQMVTGDSIPASVSGTGVMQRIMAQTTYEEFGSSRATGQSNTDPVWIRRRGVKAELEFNPHDNVHCIIDTPFMCTAISPQDPIFQMHHCNLDRIWDAWNRQGGANSSSDLWRNMVFQDNYSAPDGSSYSHMVSDLLDISTLGYTYLAQPAPVPTPEPPADTSRDLYLQVLNGAPIEMSAVALPATANSGSVTASPAEPASVSLDTAGLNLRAVASEALAGAMAASGLAAPSARLFLRDIRPESPHETRLRIFANSPGANLDTPTEGNPNYVTSIGFFGTGPGGKMLMTGGPMEDGEADSGLSVSFDIPPSAIEPGASSVTVQIVPVPQNGAGEAGPVTVTELELAVL